MIAPSPIPDPSRQLQMLSSPETIELSSLYPRRYLLPRIIFMTLICLSLLVGVLFSDVHTRTLGYLNMLEASVWLLCGLSAPVILYRDPAIWMKMLAFIVILIFSFDFLKNTW